MKMSPCKGCKDRIVGCHSNCKKYIEWRKELDKAQENKNRSRYKACVLYESLKR